MAYFFGKKVVKPVKSAKPVKVVKPVKSAKPVKVVKPVKSAKSVKVVDIPLSKTCSQNLVKLFHDVESEPYNYENRKNFKEKVRTFEKAIKHIKEESGIKVTKQQTDENRIRRLRLMSKQLPDKPCIVDQSSIILESVGSDVKLNAYETNHPEYFKKMFTMCKNVLGHNRIIIPIGIRNYKNGGDSRHSNIIIVDLDTNEAWRIEPNKVNKRNIKRYKKVLEDFFNLIGISFKGFYPETCPIIHGGLCRYVTYAQYLYGKELDYNRLKNVILQFLKDDILELCTI